MSLAEFGLWIAKLAILCTMAVMVTSVLYQVYTTPKTRQQGVETIHPVPRSHSSFFICAALFFLGGGLWLASFGTLWALLPISFAAVGFLAVPGQIVTDAQGIRQTRQFLLLPRSARELRWEEVDSMYEEVARDRHGRSYYQLVVSAGPDKTIEFSPWHVGREEFVKAVEARGIPVVRVPKPV